MKKLFFIFIGLSLIGFSVMSQVENLFQVYQQVCISNFDLCKLVVDCDVVFEKINEVCSLLLFQFGLGVDYIYINGYCDSNGVNFNVISGLLQLMQVLFDMLKWCVLMLQEKMVGIQDVMYQIDQ